MSAEILERLTTLEVQQTTTNQALGTLTEAMTTMTKEVTELAAALKHPDPAHCVKREEIADHEARLRRLEQRADTAQGGGKVILWLISGGNLATLGAIIYFLWQLAQHLPR